MKVTITSKDASKPPKVIEVESGQEIQVESGDKIHLTPDADNPAVIILPNGSDLIVMLADGTWITLVGANDPGVVGQDGGIEVSIEGIGVVISAENSFTSYQGILLNNSMVGIHEGGAGTPFYEPILDLNNFFLLGLLPLPVLTSLENLYGFAGMPGLLIGDKLVFVGPLIPGLQIPGDEPDIPADGCHGVTLFGSALGGSSLIGTPCNDFLFGYGDHNLLNAFAGDDLLRVSSFDTFSFIGPGGESYGSYAGGEAGDNTLLGGDGSDRAEILVSGVASTQFISEGFTGGDAYAGASGKAGYNYIKSTPGNDQILVDVSADADASIESYGEAVGPFGEVVAASYGEAVGGASAKAYENTLIAGGGNDVLTLMTESAADASIEASAEGGIYGEAAVFGSTQAFSKSYAGFNSMDGGSGFDPVTLSSSNHVGSQLLSNASASGYSEGPPVAVAYAEAYGEAGSIGISAGVGNSLVGGDGLASVSVTVENEQVNLISANAESAPPLSAYAYAEALAEGYVGVPGAGFAFAAGNVLSGGEDADRLEATAYNDVSSVIEGDASAVSANGSARAWGQAEGFGAAKGYSAAVDNTEYGFGGDNVLSAIAENSLLASIDSYALAESFDGRALAISRARGFDKAYGGALAEGNVQIAGDGLDNLEVRANGDASALISAAAIAESAGGGAIADARAGESAGVLGKSAASYNYLDGGAGDDSLIVLASNDIESGVSSDASATVSTVYGEGGNAVAIANSYGEAVAVGSAETGNTLGGGNYLYGGEGEDTLGVYAEGDVDASISASASATSDGYGELVNYGESIIRVGEDANASANVASGYGEISASARAYGETVASGNLLEDEAGGYAELRVDAHNDVDADLKAYAHARSLGVNGDAYAEAMIGSSNDYFGPTANVNTWAVGYAGASYNRLYSGDDGGSLDVEADNETEAGMSAFAVAEAEGEGGDASAVSQVGYGEASARVYSSAEGYSGANENVLVGGDGNQNLEVESENDVDSYIEAFSLAFSNGASGKAYGAADASAESSIGGYGESSAGRISSYASGGAIGNRNNLIAEDGDNYLLVDVDNDIHSDIGAYTAALSYNGGSADARAQVFSGDDRDGLSSSAKGYAEAISNVLESGDGYSELAVRADNHSSADILADAYAEADAGRAYAMATVYGETFNLPVASAIGGAEATDNFLLGGDGGNDMEVESDNDVDARISANADARSGVGKVYSNAAYATAYGEATAIGENDALGNTLESGDGEDDLHVDLDQWTYAQIGAESYSSSYGEVAPTGRSHSSARGEADADADAAGSWNSLSGGDGADNLHVDLDNHRVEASIEAIAVGNGYTNGYGSQAYAYSEGFGNYANATGNIRGDYNTLDGGGAADYVEVSVDNNVEASIYAEARGAYNVRAGVYGEVHAEGRAYGENNLLNGGGGDDYVEVSVDNEVRASLKAYADDGYSAIATARGRVGAYGEVSVANNILNGGEGHDELIVEGDGYSGAHLRAEIGNARFGGAYLYGDATAIDVVQVDRNSLYGGVGNDELLVSSDSEARALAGRYTEGGSSTYAFAESMANADQNLLDGGDGDYNDTLSVSSQAYAEAAADTVIGSNASAVSWNNTLLGGDGDDELTVSAYARAFSSDNSGFAIADAGGNSLLGAAGNDSLLVRAESVGDNTGSSANNNDLYGGSGIDTLDVIAIGSDANGNLLDGGNNDDFLSVKAVATGASSARANRNRLIGGAGGGSGNDVLLVSALAFGSAYANANSLYGGDGSDTMTVSAESTSGYMGDVAQANSNYMDAGAGDDTLIVTATGSTANNNTLLGGADNDSLEVSAYGNGDSAEAVGNSLSGGSGNDVLSVSATSDDGYADAGSSLSGGSNTLDGGSGNDRLSILADDSSGNATAKAYASEMNLLGDDGNDTLSITANTYAYDSADDSIGVSDADARAYADARSYANDNVLMGDSLSGGDGNDVLSVSAFSEADASARAEASDRDDVYDRDYAEALADSSAVASAVAVADADAASYADHNYLYGGGGDDSLSVSADSDAYAYAYARASAYSYADAFSYGEAGSAYAESYAEVSLDLDANASASSFVQNNSLLGGDGSDTLRVEASANAGSDYAESVSMVSQSIATSLYGPENENAVYGPASTNAATLSEEYAWVISNSLNGGDGDDVLELVADASNGGINSNTVDGGIGDDQITVDSVDSQDAQSIISSNTFDGGADVDTLSVDAGGAVSLAGGISNIEVLDLQNGEINAVFLDGGDVKTMLGGVAGTLRLVGDLGQDSFNLDDWTATGPAMGGYTTLQSTLDNTIFVETNLVGAPPPIVLDLNGDGIAEFTQIGGNRFDVDGDGELESIAWAGAGDAVLAFDANGDGMISSLEEIAFASYVPGATSDLEGLSAFDTNDDGLFSAEDDEFGSFFLWQESNLDGVGSGLELISLADAGIQSINLDALSTDGYSSGHGFVQGLGEFTWEDGSTGQLADAIFLTQEESVDLDGVLDEESGASSEDEALVAAVDDGTDGGGSGGGDGVPVLPEAPADSTDPLDPTEEEMAAV